jgi:hypothetical protein
MSELGQSLPKRDVRVKSANPSISDMIVQGRQRREGQIENSLHWIDRHEPTKSTLGQLFGQFRRREVRPFEPSMSPLIYLRVAEPVIRTRQIALPAGVAGIGFRQPVNDGETVLVRRECRRKVTLRLLHVADLVQRHRQIVLRGGVAGHHVLRLCGAGRRVT